VFQWERRGLVSSKKFLAGKGNFLTATATRPALGLALSVIQLVPGTGSSFPDGKATEHEADYSHRSSAEMKYALSF
jgi:hypothetical protein